MKTINLHLLHRFHFIASWSQTPSRQHPHFQAPDSKSTREKSAESSEFVKALGLRLQIWKLVGSEQTQKEKHTHTHTHNHTQQTNKQNVHGVVPGKFGGILFTAKHTHKQTNKCWPPTHSPGQARTSAFVSVPVFFLFLPESDLAGGVEADPL